MIDLQPYVVIVLSAIFLWWWLTIPLCKLDSRNKYFICRLCSALKQVFKPKRNAQSKRKRKQSYHPRRS